MSDTVQTVLIIIAISSMPLGVVLHVVLFMLMTFNRKTVAANRLEISALNERVAVLEAGVKP